LEQTPSGLATFFSDVLDGIEPFLADILDRAAPFLDGIAEVVVASTYNGLRWSGGDVRASGWGGDATASGHADWPHANRDAGGSRRTNEHDRHSSQGKKESLHRSVSCRKTL